MSPQRRRDTEKEAKNYFGFLPLSCLRLALCLCVSAAVFASVSCTSKPADLRTLVPGESLIYLETNDLGRAVRSVTESKPFLELAKEKPDLSALDGIQLAVAVTGFETSEQEITAENSILNFRPRFVAIAETHAWNWQALSFAENKLGEFINEVYGGEISLETSDKYGGSYFVWTAQDGRKAFALVQGSLIYFGNDETAIEKCLAVKRGETESIAKNSKLPPSTGSELATGYISPDGTAQIANLAGISMAMRTGEEEEVKSFVARVLPELLRNSVMDASWTAVKSEKGIEDRLTISLKPEIGAVFNETLIPGGNTSTELPAFVPADVFSATRYNLRDPQIAWRSVLLVAQKQTDEMSGKIIASFSGSLFEPYGIADAESFLSAAGTEIFTAKFDAEGERPVVIAAVKDIERVKRSIAREINFSGPAERHSGADLWRSGDGEFAAAFAGNVVIVGDADGVSKCLQAKQSGVNLPTLPAFKQFSESRVAAVTFAKDLESAVKIVGVLGDKKSDEASVSVSYLIETRFNQNGIERRTISDFGFIGAIIEQMSKDPSE